MNPANFVRVSTIEVQQNRSNFFFHKSDSSSLETAWISTMSRWNDSYWTLDNPTHGQKKNVASIQWSVDLGTYGNLLDPQWARLLDSLKRLVWSLFVDNRMNNPLKPGSARGISLGLKHLIPWLVNQGITDFGQITPSDADAFLEHLPVILSRTGSNEEPLELDEFAETAAVNALKLLRDIWNQSDVLREIGLPAPTTDPLRGASATTLAREMATKAVSWISPVPDEVAIPILDVAFRWLDVPARDILSLLDMYVDARSGSASVAGQNLRARQALSGRSFSRLASAKSSWHPPLPIAVRSPEKNTKVRSPTGILRDLVNDLTGACLIVVQALSGIRASELCSLLGGRNQDTGLPACVDVRMSQSGFLEIFYLRATLCKTTSAPQGLEWVIGCRAAGSDYIPEGVKALDILEQLYSPWRSLGTPKLWRGLPQRGFPRKESGVASAPHSALNSSLQRVFINRHVNLTGLSDRSRHGEDLIPYRSSDGTCLRPHQWRKTFAIWLHRYDSHLLASISQHFKHLSLAMTEQGYLSNDATLLDTMESAHQRAAASFFYEAILGTRVVTGAIGKLLDKHGSSIKTLIVADSNTEMQQKALEFVRTNSIKIFFAEHGKCFLNLKPEKSRCNSMNGVANWRNTAPDFHFRSPDLCSGCDCFAVDSDHTSFWLRRYLDNRRVWNLAKENGIEKEYRIAFARAAQAKQILSVLQISIPSTDKQD